jgi:hypothetical protein
MYWSKAEGRWVIARRLQGRPTGASAQFHLTTESFIKVSELLRQPRRMHNRCEQPVRTGGLEISAVTLLRAPNRQGVQVLSLNATRHR